MSIHQHIIFPVRYFYPNVPLYDRNQPPFYGVNTTIPCTTIDPFTNYESGTCAYKTNSRLCNKCSEGSYPVVSNDKHCYCFDPSQQKIFKKK